MLVFEHRIIDDERRKPIRRILALRLPEISQIRLKRLIVDGQVLVNDIPVGPVYRGKVGDVISISSNEPVEGAFLPEAMPLDVVYEDEELVVVNKPAGMLVHPSNTQKTGTLLNAVCYHLKQNAQVGIRPGLVHRLDKQTSGLIVLAKNERSHRTLAKHFTNHWIEKKYLGIVIGFVSDDTGLIDAPIGSYKEAFPHWRVMENGRAAQTGYRVLNRFGSKNEIAHFTLLELTPLTGRTNQLRIHLASMGFPLVNDYVYGQSENVAVFGALEQSSTTSRHFLHAAEIKFRHPTSGDWITLSAPLPSDMRGFLSSLILERQDEQIETASIKKESSTQT